MCQMSPELEALLGKAYELFDVQHDMDAARGLLDASLIEGSPLRYEASMEHERIYQVSLARGLGDRVNVVLLTLLNAAFGDPANARIPSSIAGFTFVADGVGGLIIQSPDGSLTPVVVKNEDVP